MQMYARMLKLRGIELATVKENKIHENNSELSNKKADQTVQTDLHFCGLHMA